MANWYVSSAKWTAVAAWSSGAKVVGDICRQGTPAPAVGSERVFRCTVAGTTAGTEPATWNTGKGVTTSDGTVTWTEITGQAIFNGDGGGTAWAAPHARLQNALASGWAVAGDRIYVGSAHAEIQAAALTITPLGTVANPQQILCVDEAVVPPTTPATTATITMAATGVNLVIANGGAATFSGITFQIPNAALGNAQIRAGGSASGTPTAVYFENCQFLNNNTVSSAGSFSIALGSNTSGSGGPSSLTEFRNCNFATNNITNLILLGYGDVSIIGGAIVAGASAAVPVPPFTMAPGASGTVPVRDMDLSLINGALFFATISSSGGARLQNCRLHASATLPAAPVGPGGSTFRLENSDSGATNYRYANVCYGGTITNEMTIVRTGGASNGVNPFSLRVQTNANNKTFQPLKLDLLSIWNDLVGAARTLTIEIVSNASLTNADIWMEYEYLGSASFPLGTIVSTRIANPLIGATALASSGAAWVSAPSFVQHIVSPSFTPQMKGLILPYLFVGKASQLLYIDPQPVVT